MLPYLWGALYFSKLFSNHYCIWYTQLCKEMLLLPLGRWGNQSPLISDLLTSTQFMKCLNTRFLEWVQFSFCKLFNNWEHAWVSLKCIWISTAFQFRVWSQTTFIQKCLSDLVMKGYCSQHLLRWFACPIPNATHFF